MCHIWREPILFILCTMTSLFWRQSRSYSFWILVQYFCVCILCTYLFLRIKQVILHCLFDFEVNYLHLSYSIRDVDPCSPPTSHWRGQVGEQTQKLHARQVQDHGSNAFIFHPGSRRNKIRGNVHWTRKSGSSSKKEKYNSILQKERWVHDWEILKIPACILFVYQEK